MAEMNEPQFPSVLVRKSFLQALFDFDFNEWVTLRIAGLLYGVLIALTTVLVLGIALSGAEFAVFIGSLIGAVLAWFLLVILFRLAIEASIAAIAVAQNTANLRK